MKLNKIQLEVLQKLLLLEEIFLTNADKVCMILGDNFIYGRGFPGDLRMILNNKIKNRATVFLCQ